MLEAIILGIVQGFTEFLPVSNAHLHFISLRFLGWKGITVSGLIPLILAIVAGFGGEMPGDVHPVGCILLVWLFLERIFGPMLFS